MATTQWLVLSAGIAGIVLVNWYFLFAERSSARAVAAPGGREIEIVVRGGYEPGVIRVKRGVRTRLVFDRQETSTCSEEVVIGTFGIRRFLPPFEKTVVEITPAERGTFEITCGMSMLHAKLVVED